LSLIEDTSGVDPNGVERIRSRDLSLRPLRKRSDFYVPYEKYFVRV